MSKSWPRLSVTAPGPREPGRCTWCGAHGMLPKQALAGYSLTLWQECDHNDKPESIYLWLCKACTDELIEPHVRLYESKHHWFPAIGAMELCRNCTHRQGLKCTNPTSLTNGGPGMGVDAGNFTMAFIDGTRNGRRTGWRERFYTEPPKRCVGFKPFDTGVEAVEL